MYALFKDGKLSSKLHNHMQAAWIEAFEIKVIYDCRYGKFLSEGYTIEEVKE